MELLLSKGKYVPVLNYTPRQIYGGVEIKLHAFFISALDKGEWSAPRSGYFRPGIN
jgi:hypothetical protein